MLVRATVENLGDIWDVLIGNPERGGEHVIEMY